MSRAKQNAIRRQFEGGKPLRQTGANFAFHRLLGRAMLEAGISAETLAQRCRDRFGERRRGILCTGSASATHIRDIKNFEGSASPDVAWIIMQTLGEILPWCSGPLGLAAANFDEHLIGTIGWMLVDGFTDEVRGLWPGLCQAPYSSALFPFRNAMSFEMDCLKRYAYENDAEARQIAWAIDRRWADQCAEEGIPLGFQLKATVELPTDFASHLAYSEAVLLGSIHANLATHSLDRAWENFSQRNAREPIARYLREAINGLAGFRNAPPPDATKAAWAKVHWFFAAVDRLGFEEGADFLKTQRLSA